MTRAPSSGVGDVERSKGGSDWVPEPLATSLTPSGIEIAFYEQPKRKYEIRPPASKRLLNEPEFPWREVPSVTTVFGKPELAWWGMQIGVQNTLQLIAKGELLPARLEDGTVVLATLDASRGLVTATAKHVEELLKLHKLTTSDTRDRAGERGQAAHDALEEWAKTGTIPAPSDYGPEEKGYIEGLAMFLEALYFAGVEDIKTEVMVGSLEHGYAGRYDLEFRTTRPVEIVKRWTPKRGPQYATLSPGFYLWDLKSSKGVYENYAKQMAGYELARIECGYPRTDDRIVIRVHPGEPNHKYLPPVPHYELVRSWATASDFLYMLDVWKADQEMNLRKKEIKWH